MENQQKVNTRGHGITFLGCLGLLFIGLKLTNSISWSWWLVLLPLYGPFALALVVMVFLTLLVGVLSVIENTNNRNKRIK